MDIVTQGLFGAVVALAFFGRAHGAQAAVAGFVAGLVPDLDMISKLWSIEAYWEHRRGFTHAVWFAPLAGPLLGWLWWRYERWRRPPFAGGVGRWIGLFILVLLTHPLLDMATIYGAPWLAPFEETRFAYSALPVTDLGVIIILVLAVLVGAWLGLRSGGTAAVAFLALIFVAGYAGLAGFSKQRIETAARAELDRKGIEAAEVTSFPALLQPVYRRVVARVPGPTDEPDQLWIGFRSIRAPGPIAWRRFVESRAPGITTVADSALGRQFIRFADARVFWTATTVESGLRIRGTDIRSGTQDTAILGVWGISAVLGPAGRLRAEPVAFEEPVPLDMHTLELMWQGLAGS